MTSSELFNLTFPVVVCVISICVAYVRGCYWKYGKR